VKAAISSQFSAISRYKDEPTKHLIVVRFVLTAYSLELTARVF
jgi:hypothetical protein